jgi:DNA-binding NarL/FixJ family response regulator
MALTKESSKTKHPPSPARGKKGKRTHPVPRGITLTRLKQAEARAAQAEARTELAKTRTELAETRTEQAETRTEMAKTRTEQAEIRSEQAEAALEMLVHKVVKLTPEITPRLLKNIPIDGAVTAEKNPLEKLTDRQREILRLVAEGQNTKQIAGILKISPKTVEYHRLKLMNSLDVHDIPGLVRFALRAGMIGRES